MERLVREGVDEAPRKLLRREVIDVRQLEQLRQCGAVAKDVRQPQIAHVYAELLREETFAQEQLADERLTARDVGVGLDPHRALRLQSSLAHLVLDLGVEGGVVLLHPQKVLRLARAEDVVGVALHQFEGRGESARAFADRLPNGPQPAQIDVGVPHRADAQRRVAAAFRQERREHSARFFGDRRDAPVQQGNDIVQAGEDLLVTRRVFRQDPQEVEQHLEVVIERADVVVARRDCGLVERAVVMQLAEEVVTAGVGPHVDAFAALGAVGDLQDALARFAEAEVVTRRHAGKAPHRDAVRVEDAHFAVHVE